MKILNKTKCYLAGAIQLENKSISQNWRNEFEQKTKEIGIVCLNPLKKMFKNFENESFDYQDKLLELLKIGDYAQVHHKCKSIIRKDYAAIDRADFLVVVLNPKIPTWGTNCEIFLAQQLRKPVFLVIDGGYKNIPLWWAGLFKPKWVYDNIDDVVLTLKKIDSNKIKLNKKYWRILEDTLM